jgi:nucleosome binding factor SPN SPT16 subunit
VRGALEPLVAVHGDDNRRLWRHSIVPNPRRNQRYGDADEIHLEEKEREAQKRLDDAFRSFIKKAMEVATDVRFEKPERKAGIYEGKGAAY